MALFGLVAYVGWCLHHAGVPTVCHDEVAQTGRVVRVCAEMSITDPRAAYLALVAALLLFPELTELEIAGLLAIKRRLPVEEDHE